MYLTSLHFTIQVQCTKNFKLFFPGNKCASWNNIQEEGQNKFVLINFLLMDTRIPDLRKNSLGEFPSIAVVETLPVEYSVFKKRKRKI